MSLTTSPSATTSEPRRRLAERAGLAYRWWATRRPLPDADTTVDKVRHAMRRKTYCLVVTDGLGATTARVVQPHRPADDLSVVIGTSASSRKVAAMRDSGRCLLVYEDDRRATCVVLHCATAVLSPTDSRRHFMPGWRAFWPDGPGDDFVAVRCIPDTIEVWSGRDRITPPPFGLASLRMSHEGRDWVIDGPTSSY